MQRLRKSYAFGWSNTNNKTRFDRQSLIESSKRKLYITSGTNNAERIINIVHWKRPFRSQSLTVADVTTQTEYIYKIEKSRACLIIINVQVCVSFIKDFIYTNYPINCSIIFSRILILRILIRAHYEGHMILYRNKQI